MNLQDLVAANDLAGTVVEMIQELVDAKSRTRELGNVRRMPEIDDLIRDELSRAAELPERLPSADDRAAVDRFFLDLVNA